jgi:hypothetical protein
LIKRFEQDPVYEVKSESQQGNQGYVMKIEVPKYRYHIVDHGKNYNPCERIYAERQPIKINGINIGITISDYCPILDYSRSCKPEVAQQINEDEHASEKYPTRQIGCNNSRGKVGLFSPR